MRMDRDDLDFASDINAAVHKGPPRITFVFLILVSALFVSFLTWAALAQIDEVTRGDATIVPSSKIQVVQSLEGGIVKELDVRVGDKVAKGQVLLRIDDTGFSSNLGELKARDWSLRAQVARLQFEFENGLSDTIAFPDDLVAAAPDVVANERQLFTVRQQNLRNQINILEDRLDQRKLELGEQKAGLARSEANLALAEEESALKAPLAASGIVPRTDMLKLQREVADLKGQIATAAQTIPRLESAITEAERQIEEQALTFRQNARAELNQKAAELAVTTETMKSATDKVARSDLRAPVDGIVNRLHVTTVGGVVKAGEDLVEIVPLEDTLLVEARVRPADIAFIHPNQDAVVKITAYDFSIYGGLPGKVERISADTVFDEESRERFYTVTVRTDKASLGKGNVDLPIIPGMVASVDILTGKKSVLDYLLKPILKARYEALRER